MTRPQGIGEPVFQPQSGYTPELPFVIRDERGADAACVSRQQEVACGDWSPAPLECFAYLSVMNTRTRFERQDIQIDT